MADGTANIDGVNAGPISLRIARDIGDLKPHVAAWAALSAAAAEANVFYENGAVIAALQHLAAPGPLRFLFVYAGDRLIGFFPFMRAPAAKRPPRYCSYRHLHCYLSTPLVHAAHLDAALDALLRWIDSAPDGIRLFEFNDITLDGPVGQALLRRMAARRQPFAVMRQHLRAFFAPAVDAETYLARTLTTKKRKEYRRQRRRLAEHGTLAPATFTDGPLRPWADDFLALETAGWKGRDGWAFGRSTRGRAFFRDFLAHFHATGRLILHRMTLGGKPIAMKCNLLADGPAGAGRGAFAFKIAYDEAYAAYSPGVLLELDNIAALHAAPGIAWMDSCADPDHPMIDHLWDGRRRIGYIACASRGIRGRLLVAFFNWRTMGKNAQF